MVDKPLVAVFTPTYNRATYLVNCYNSLVKQTCKSFEWYIIDDGSTDSTAELVQGWIEEERFKISYYYKENGGLHTGYNKALEVMDNELCMCIDSDDWMPEDAIQIISKLWGTVDQSKYVGIMGLDHYEDRTVVGDAFPEDLEQMYLYEKLVKYKIRGDKKLVHKTKLLESIAPMPCFYRERFFNPSHLMYELDQFGPLYLTNECLCIVDYQDDGMSNNMVKQYVTSPNSYAEMRKQYLGFPEASCWFRLKQNVHLVSSYILAKKVLKVVKESPTKLLTILALPLGLLLAMGLKCSYYVDSKKTKESH